MTRTVVSSLIAMVIITAVLRLRLPGADDGIRPARVSGQGRRQPGRRSTGTVVGSRLAGQEFTKSRYFHGRLSATSPTYNAAGTTLLEPRPDEPGPRRRRSTSRSRPSSRLEGPYNPGLTAGDIPVDAVTTSGSGIDPHITPAYAQLQAPRVAANRGLTLERVLQLVDDSTDDRFVGFWGEPGVNVLELNLALDQETHPMSHPVRRASSPARSSTRAVGDSFLKLDPRHLFRNPVIFIVEIGSVITTVIFVLDAIRGTGAGALVHRRDLDLALADGALRELRRGRRRGSREGPGSLAASHPHDDDRPPADGQRRRRGRARDRAAAGRRRRRDSGRADPGRRRGDRRRRIGGRVRHHGRVRPRHPRGGRRPIGRHRRDAPALRPARRRKSRRSRASRSSTT